MTSLYSRGMLAIVLCLTLLFVIAGVSLLKSRAVQATQDSTPPIPKLKSEVPGVEIESAKPVQDGQLLIVTIRNRTDVGITSYSLSCGNFTTTYEPAIYTDDEVVLAAPGKTAEARISSKVLKGGKPLVLRAVLFADGSAQGLPQAIEESKELRKTAKESRKQKKGVENQ